ncbi:hypothetical protein FQN60_014329, partial [Etheostoma spectabile]
MLQIAADLQSASSLFNTGQPGTDQPVRRATYPAGKRESCPLSSSSRARCRFFHFWWDLRGPADRDSPWIRSAESCSCVISFSRRCQPSLVPVLPWIGSGWTWRTPPAGLGSDCRCGLPPAPHDPPQPHPERRCFRSSALLQKKGNHDIQQLVIEMPKVSELDPTLLSSFKVFCHAAKTLILKRNEICQM